MTYSWRSGYPGDVVDVFLVPDSRDHIFVAGGDYAAVEQLMRQCHLQGNRPLGDVSSIQPVPAEAAEAIRLQRLGFLALDQRPLPVWVKIKRHNIYRGDNGLLHILKPGNSASTMMAWVIVLPRLPPSPNEHTARGLNNRFPAARLATNSVPRHLEGCVKAINLPADILQVTYGDSQELRLHHGYGMLEVPHSNLEACIPTHREILDFDPDIARRHFPTPPDRKDDLQVRQFIQRYPDLASFPDRELVERRTQFNAITHVPMSTFQNIKIGDRVAMDSQQNDRTWKVRAIDAATGMVDLGGGLEVHIDELRVSFKPEDVISYPVSRPWWDTSTHRRSIVLEVGNSDLKILDPISKDGFFMIHQRFCQTAEFHDQDFELAGAFDRLSSLHGSTSNLRASLSQASVRQDSRVGRYVHIVGGNFKGWSAIIYEYRKDGCWVILQGSRAGGSNRQWIPIEHLGDIVSNAPVAPQTETLYQPRAPTPPPSDSEVPFADSSEPFITPSDHGQDLTPIVTTSHSFASATSKEFARVTLYKMLI